MKLTATTFAGALALLVMTAPLAHAATGRFSEQDTSFAKRAAEGGRAEVKFGKMAAERAATPAVKQFGQQMVADHARANDQLRDYAQKQNVELPDGMDSMHRNLEKRMRKLKGVEFDRAYMQSQIQDHQTQIALFEQQASQGRDPQLKAWAAQTLPILQQHYQMAQQTAQSGSGATGGAATGGGAASGGSGSTGGGF